MPARSPRRRLYEPEASPEPRDGCDGARDRKRLFINKRDRQEFNTRLAALAFEKLCTFCTSVPKNGSLS